MLSRIAESIFPWHLILKSQCCGIEFWLEIDGHWLGKSSRGQHSYSSGPQPFWHQGPGTGFVEDGFPTEGGVGGREMGDGSGCSASNGEWQMKLRSPATHLLLFGPVVPNRWRPGDP